MKLKRKCCKCKYNVRWFNSKQAFLVLVWVVFYVGAVSSFVRTGQTIQRSFYFLKWINGVIIPYFFVALFLPCLALDAPYWMFKGVKCL